MLSRLSRRSFSSDNQKRWKSFVRQDKSIKEGSQTQQLQAARQYFLEQRESKDAERFYMDAVRNRRGHNMSPGPSQLKLQTMVEIQREFLNFEGTGQSFMELPTRDSINGPVPRTILNAEQHIRDLMDVPNNYHVLFFAGGAHGQFSAVPMHLAMEGKAAFGISGYWSRRAQSEADKYCDKVYDAYDCEDWAFASLPKTPEAWNVEEGTDYVHICSNETIQGLQYHFDPDISKTNAKVLTIDMTSDFMSRPVDVSKYGVIFASSGKNLGPSGVTVVIVRDDLVPEVGSAMQQKIPSVLDWQKMSVAHYDGGIHNTYNTPPIFQIYCMEKVLADLKKTEFNGKRGLEGVQMRNARAAGSIYDVIDWSMQDTREERHGGVYYWNVIADRDRSHTSIPMRIMRSKGDGAEPQPDLELEELFLKEAEKQGFFYLRGHPLFGGIRVTLYNAIVQNGAAKPLADFMKEFIKAMK